MLLNIINKKSCIRETKNLSTDVDSRTDTILERLPDLSERRKKIYIYISFKKFETILWNYFLPKSLKLSSSKTLKQFSSKNSDTNCVQNLWKNFPQKPLKIFSSKIFNTNFLQNLWRNVLQNVWKNFPPKSLTHTPVPGRKKNCMGRGQIRTQADITATWKNRPGADSLKN